MVNRVYHFVVTQLLYVEECACKHSCLLNEVLSISADISLILKYEKILIFLVRNASIIKLHFLLVILYFHSVKKPRHCNGSRNLFRGSFI